MLELTAGGWTQAIIAAMSVGMAKGGLSMVGLISVPLLSLVMSPVQAVGLMLPVYVISDVGGLIAFRRSFDRGCWQPRCPAPWPGSASVGRAHMWCRSGA